MGEDQAYSHRSSTGTAAGAGAAGMLDTASGDAQYEQSYTSTGDGTASTSAPATALDMVDSLLNGDGDMEGVDNVRSPVSDRPVADQITDYIDRFNEAVYGPRYEFGKETIAGYDPFHDGAESGELGIDVIQTKTGEMKVVEYHVNQFGTRGFSAAFDNGNVHSVMNRQRSGDFTNYLKRFEPKTRLYNAVPYHTTKPVSNLDNLHPDEKVVVKPGNSSRGRGIDVMQAGNVDSTFSMHPFRFGEKKVERFLDGKEIIHNNRPYKACGRLVVPWELEDGVLKTKQGGMYWRTPEKPVDDPLATPKEKYVANLAQGGHAVPAAEYEQEMAYQTANDILYSLFQQWTTEQAQDYL